MFCRSLSVGVRITRYLDLCVPGTYVFRCMSFCTFSLCHCVVCSSPIYKFWLPIWYLQALLITARYATNWYVFQIYLSSPPDFSGVPVIRSLVLWVCFVDRCLYFFLLAIVCSVLLRFTDSDYPLVSSNSSYDILCCLLYE
jgi:hypothetical protein